MRPLPRSFGALMVYLLIFLVVALDQFTKWIMTTWLEKIGTFPIFENILHFTYATNTGAAWGILKDARWVFLVISSVAILAIFVYLIFAKHKIPGAKWALALICGGGIGNMIDRLILGYVVDFIDFRLINFPIFNLADSCVCIGTFLFVFFYLRDEWKKEKQKAGLL